MKNIFAFFLLLSISCPLFALENAFEACRVSNGTYRSATLEMKMAGTFIYAHTLLNRDAFHRLEMILKQIETNARDCEQFTNEVVAKLSELEDVLKRLEEQLK